MSRHLLVTNDFPPKLGGIQSYLWELWRRLDPASFVVLTTPHPGAAAFDSAQPFRVERDRSRVLLPTPALTRRIDRLADEFDADLVLLDPVLPLGFVGPRLRHRYGIVVHGAEVTVAAQARLGKLAMSSVLRDAELVIAAGSFPAREAERIAGRDLPIVDVPPGVDPERFVPIGPDARAAARRRFGVPVDAQVVASLSRLVPRKGFDVLIQAAARLVPEFPDLVVMIGGTGRDRARLERLAHQTRSPVTFVGRVDDDDLPAFYGCSDVFAMLCRNRWAGIEQEGFGIVFLEAASCGVPQLAGRSGGSEDAVAADETGLVLADPRSIGDAASALRRLLLDRAGRSSFGEAGRQRVLESFSYDVLAPHLAEAIDATVSARS